MGMWDNVGKNGSLPFKENQNGAVSGPSKMTPEEAEEEKKKRKSLLRYNRGKNGIFGDKEEPELIEKDI